MEDLDSREEQLQSIKAVYDGLNMFVCLRNGIWKKSLLPGHSFRDGLQAGKNWDFQN